jgi:hypothetical protein
MKRFLTLGLLLVVALSVAGCGMISTGESAAEKGTQIAEFDVPAGFTPDFGMDVGGTVMVGYSQPNTNSHFFLIQAPESSGMTVDQLEQALRDAIASSAGSEAVEATEVEEIPVTIRGEEVTATVGSGSGSGGTVPIRVLTVPFTGNGGPALLMYQTAEADWDQAAVDEFLASFR